MSLEWARARLLQHCEELRKLCEVQARRPSAAVMTLQPEAGPRPAPDVAATGKVLQFVPSGRRRRA
jgi:hypothetical protein